MYMRFVVVGTAAVFLLTACGSDSESPYVAAPPSSPAATANSAAAPPPAEVTSVAAASSSAASGSQAQCAAIKKAYTAWAKVNTSLTARNVDTAIGVGDAFSSVLRAYEDDPALNDLKWEVTGYNVQVLLARAKIDQGMVDSTTRKNLKTDHDDVVAEYDAFRTAACK